ncbi:MAG TPA: aminotransferase [Bacteroidetes bacterium]|jgi:cysteine desulfurase / selenocysteine lyase|nr:aminotransferase [Bacteroidota bacterium]
MIFPKLLTEQTLASARSLFPHTSLGKIYLNHAGTSPLSIRVVGAMTNYLRERSEGKLETYQDDLPMVAELRSFVQRLINAESTERIALTGNTSDAINIIAGGITWRSGDRILLNNIEFPANVWPYLNLKQLGVEIDIIHSSDGRVTTEQIEQAITPRTRLVGLSAVQFLSGHRADLGAIGTICKHHGIIFAVDGIQAVGAVKLDVQAMKIDALAAGGQKWQMSPHGTGFLYLTEDLQSQIHQTNLGWLSVADPWDFYNYNQELDRTARRFEGGSLIMPSLWGMHAALGTILEFGLETIEAHLLALTQKLIEGFQKIEGIQFYTPSRADERAGIVSIELPPNADPKNVFKQLLQKGITAAVREGMLRYSPHFYCSAEEMQATAEATAECIESSP